LLWNLWRKLVSFEFSIHVELKDLFRIFEFWNFLHSSLRIFEIFWTRVWVRLYKWMWVYGWLMTGCGWSFLWVCLGVSGRWITSTVTPSHRRVRFRFISIPRPKISKREVGRFLNSKFKIWKNFFESNRIFGFYTTVLVTYSWLSTKYALQLLWTKLIVFLEQINIIMMKFQARYNMNVKSSKTRLKCWGYFGNIV